TYFTLDNILNNGEMAQKYEEINGVPQGTLRNLYQQFNLAYGKGPQNVNGILFNMSKNTAIMDVFHKAGVIDDLKEPNGNYKYWDDSFMRIGDKPTQAMVDAANKINTHLQGSLLSKDKIKDSNIKLKEK